MTDEITHKHSRSLLQNPSTELDVDDLACLGHRVTQFTPICCQDTRRHLFRPPHGLFMASPPLLTEQLEELLGDLRDIQNQRFRWVEQCKSDFRGWVTKREGWDRQAEAVLWDLKNAGRHEQAGQLSSALAAHHLVSQPGSFDIVYTGVEKMIVFFEGREATQKSSVSSVVMDTPCSGTDTAHSEMASVGGEEERDSGSILVAEDEPYVVEAQPSSNETRGFPNILASRPQNCKRVCLFTC